MKTEEIARLRALCDDDYTNSVVIAAHLPRALDEVERLNEYIESAFKQADVHTKDLFR